MGQDRAPIFLLNSYKLESQVSKNDCLEMYSVDEDYKYILYKDLTEYELEGMKDKDIIVIKRNNPLVNKLCESNQSIDDMFYISSLNMMEGEYSISIIDENKSNNDSNTTNKLPIFVVFDKVILPMIMNFIPALAVLLIEININKKKNQHDKFSETFETEIIYNRRGKKKCKVIKFKGTKDDFNNVMERISSFVDKE